MKNYLWLFVEAYIAFLQPYRLHFFYNSYPGRCPWANLLQAFSLRKVCEGLFGVKLISVFPVGSVVILFKGHW